MVPLLYILLISYSLTLFCTVDDDDADVQQHSRCITSDNIPLSDFSLFSTKERERKFICRQTSPDRQTDRQTDKQEKSQLESISAFASFQQKAGGQKVRCKSCSLSVRWSDYFSKVCRRRRSCLLLLLQTPVLQFSLFPLYSSTIIYVIVFLQCITLLLKCRLAS